MYRRGQIWWATIGGIRKSSGTTVKKDAEAYFAGLKKQLWEQTHMGAKAPRSWEESVVRYLKECQGRPSYVWKTTVLRWWADQLDTPKDIRDITRDRVDDILSPLSTVEPSSGNHTLNKKAAILHNLLTKASEEWEWIERTPKFRTYPIPPSRERYLTVTEWRLLTTILQRELKDFCTLALATGLRSGKLTELSWRQYDAGRRILTVSGNGTKRANPIPLNQTAVDVLEARRTAQTRHLTRVFPEYDEPPIKRHLKWWNAHVRTIPELEDVGIHTLRHTFGTWLGQAGIPRPIVKVLMGHSDMDINAVYTHWADQNLRPAVEVIDTILSQAEQNKKGSQGA